MVSPLPPPPKRSPGVGVTLFAPCTSASMMDAPAEPVARRFEVFVLPSSQIVLLPVKSVIPKLPAPSALPAPAEMMFHVCPPALVLAIENQVPKPLALPIESGVYVVADGAVPIPVLANRCVPVKVLFDFSCGTLVVSRFRVTTPRPTTGQIGARGNSVDNFGGVEAQRDGTARATTRQARAGSHCRDVAHTGEGL